MLFQQSECNRRKIVFHFAGILSRSITVNSEIFKESGKYLMAVIDSLSHFKSAVGKADMVIIINSNQSLIFHFLQNDRYGRTGIAQI